MATHGLTQNRIDYEAELLGCLIDGVRGVESLWEQVQESDFFNPENVRLFALLRKMHQSQEPITLASVWDEVLAQPNKEKFPDVVSLASYGDLLPYLAPTDQILAKVREASCRRRLSAVIEEMRLEVEGVHVTFADAVERIQERIAHLIHEQVLLSEQGKSDFDAASALLNSLEHQTQIRIFTDVKQLDEHIGGFLPGELVVVTAETGVGKTILAQQTKRRACSDGYRTLYCSAEMSAEHLISRVLASNAGVSPAKMRKPEQLDRDEWKRLVEVAGHSCRKCRTIDGSLDIKNISVAARKMAMQPSLGLIVLDYDELIDAPGDTENERLAELVRSAKTIAIETKSVVMLVSQMRKAQSEDSGKPGIARLYGSGAKSKHANAIIHVDRPYVRDLKGDETAASIHILKFRDGRVGYIPCQFNVRTLRFESVEQNEPQLPYRDD